MVSHLKKHNIFSNTATSSEEKPRASPAQYKLILKLIVMFIVTAGVSFRTIENKYLIRFINKFCAFKFSMPGRRKVRKLVDEYRKEKEEDAEEKLIDAENVSITADCWTSEYQKLTWLLGSHMSLF